MKKLILISLLTVFISTLNAQDPLRFQPFTQLNPTANYTLKTDQCLRENDPYGYMTYFTVESDADGDVLYVYSPDLFQLKLYTLPGFVLQKSYALNQIAELKSGGQFLSLDVSGNNVICMFSDKMVIMQLNGNTVTLINSLDINNDQGWFQQYSVNAEPQFKIRFIDNENVAIISTRYDVAVNSSEFYSGNNEVIYNLGNGTFNFVPVIYPEDYRNNYYGLALMPMRDINNMGEHIFSYMASDQVQRWTPSTNTTTSYDIKSAYKTGAHAGINKELVSNTSALITHVVNEPIYTNLLYDKYRNIYYRFFRSAIPENANCNPCNISDKPLSIMVLSENFNIIDELHFISAPYEERLAFVTNAGLYLPVNTQNMSNDLRRYFNFDVLSIDPEYKTPALQNPLQLNSISNGIFALSGHWQFTGIPVIRIYSLQGMEIYRSTYQENASIDISGNGKGIYLIVVSDDKNEYHLKYSMTGN